MNISRQHSFWGSLSPLGGLTGAGLLVMGSARLSWAVTITTGLFFVYTLTAFTWTFIFSMLRKAFPSSGQKAIYVCIASFWGSVHLFLFWLFCPFAALEVFFLLLLIPLFCAGSGIVEYFSSSQDNSHYDVFEQISQAVSQAAILSCLLIALSIIREPLSYCCLSFPGSFQGMITIMYFRENSFFPIRLFASSAGALILLGYVICLYQYSKNYIFPGDNR